MANEEKRIWGIHTTDDSLFLHNNVIAIGWKEFGDCSKLEPTRDAYKAHYIKSYPNGKKGAVATSAGMLYRFALEMKIGDYVVFPSKSDRKINIGVVESDFIYEPSAALYVQQRKVKWLKHLPRTAFSQGALYAHLFAEFLRHFGGVVQRVLVADDDARLDLQQIATAAHRFFQRFHRPQVRHVPDVGARVKEGAFGEAEGVFEFAADAE